MMQPSNLFADFNCLKLITAHDVEALEAALLDIVAEKGRDFAIDAMYFHTKAQLTASGNMPVERSEVVHLVDELIFRKLISGEAEIVNTNGL
jgi:hypothetical protein